MTTPDPTTWGAGREVKRLALATLLLVACTQLLLAACAQEVNKLAPPPADYGLVPYLETTPFLLNRLPGSGRPEPVFTTRPAPRPPLLEGLDPPQETVAGEALTAPAFLPREP